METARVRWRSEPEELGTTGSLGSVSVLPSMLEKQEATTGWRPSLVGSGRPSLPQTLHGTAIYVYIGVVPGRSMGRQSYSSPMEYMGTRWY